MALKRIQLSRARGFCLPDNTKKVDRSTKFGNPFQIDSQTDAARVVELFRNWLLGDEHIQHKYPHLADKRCVLLKSIHELRGKNLACWCKLDSPCHADVLFDMANKQP